jgi:acyl CoA:acetate/3-ketoacid CoA transferase alpha subunit
VKVEQTHATGPTLVFVYNADSGVFNTLADAAHKIFSPRTYACNLCALTHTAVRMRGEWREFLDGLGLPLEFLHADELAARYHLTGVPLPAVFTKDGRGLSVLAGADSIDACGTLDDLKRLILEGLAREGVPPPAR